MVQLIEKGTISSKIAKKVFNELIEKVETQKKSLKRNIVQISDEGTLRKVVTEILDNNEQSIEDFKTVKTVQLAS